MCGVLQTADSKELLIILPQTSHRFQSNEVPFLKLIFLYLNIKLSHSVNGLSILFALKKILLICIIPVYVLFFRCFYSLSIEIIFNFQARLPLAATNEVIFSSL